MDGGTCNSTVFHAFGYETGALCLALGNYHNMLETPATGPQAIPTAGPQIGSETIDLADFAAAVELLVQISLRFPRYKPGMNDLKKRFNTLHIHEQRRWLCGATSKPKHT
jgi:endoglucanase